MPKDRTQLNINIDPDLLLKLKSEAIKRGKTLTDFVVEQLKQTPGTGLDDSLETRLLRIEELLNIQETSFKQENAIGAIFTDDGSLAQIIQSIRIHGSGLDKYENVRIGLNGRLDTIQAAILLEKLEIFNEELTRRNEIASYYTSNINSTLQTPFIPKEYFSSWA